MKMMSVMQWLSANLAKLVIVCHLCCLLLMTYSLALAKTGVVDISPLHGVSTAFWFLLGIDMAAITLLMFVSKRKSNLTHLLFLIFTLAIFVRVIPNIKYTTVWPYFSDIAVHTAVATESKESGYIVENMGAQHYSRWPVFELILITISLSTGLSPLGIMKYIAAVISALQVLFLFLIIRDAFKNERVALFSALCLALSEVSLVSGSMAIVQPTIAHTLFLMSLFLILKCLVEPRFHYFVLYFVSSAILTISHPIVPIWFWQILLITLALGYTFLRKISPFTIRTSMMNLALFPLILTSVWYFHVATDVSQPMLKDLMRTVLERETIPEALTKITNRQFSDLLQLFPQSIFLLPFAIIGGIIFLKLFYNAASRRMYKEAAAFAFLTSMIGYLLIGFVVQYYLIGVTLFSPVRYLVYAYDFFYVLVGLGLFKSVAHPMIAKRKFALTVLVVFLIMVSFLGVQEYPSYERGQSQNIIIDTYEIASVEWGLREVPPNSIILSDTQIASAYVGFGAGRGYNLTGNPLYLDRRLHAFAEITIHQNFSRVYEVLPEVYFSNAVYVVVSTRMIKWFVGVH